MSSTELVQFRNGVADDRAEFRNSWGGAARVWDAIWAAYGTKKHEYDSWLTAAADGRLWKLWETARFTEAEKLVYLFTCDNALVAKQDFGRLAKALREFDSKHPANGAVSHLAAWADFIESSTADAIGLHATTVNENPWFEANEHGDSVPYSIASGDKHWWIADRIKESVESL